jgi:hypothetical protein
MARLWKFGFVDLLWGALYLAPHAHAHAAGILREFDPLSLERGPNALERTDLHPRHTVGNLAAGDRGGRDASPPRQLCGTPTQKRACCANLFVGGHSRRLRALLRLSARPRRGHAKNDA